MQTMGLTANKINQRILKKYKKVEKRGNTDG